MIPRSVELLNVLSDHNVTFYIPPYQRNYEWGNNQCRVFFDDILRTYKKNIGGGIAKHFFGSITFYETERIFGQPEKLVLVDGQQRITTTMLFLAALRDISDDADIKKYINDNYLVNNNVAGEENSKVKLKQVESDWPVYRDIMLEEKIDNIGKAASVYKSYAYFKKRLQNLLDGNENIKINDIVSYGLSKFSVITIQLEPNRNDGEEPQEIFESMNSIGKPLSLADLVRNYLLLGKDSSEQEQLYKKYWLNIEETLRDYISDYIRDVMQWHDKASYPKASERNYKDLYRLFKDSFEDMDTTEILKILSMNAALYKNIITGSGCGNAKIDDELSIMNKLRVTTAYSFFLCVLSYRTSGDISDRDAEDILEAFRIYIMRRRLVGLVQGENLSFPLLIKNIDEIIHASNKKHYVFEMLSSLDNRLRLPNDFEIKRYLESFNMYNFQSCRLYLAMIEESITKSRPDISESSLQIEHIMPQTLNDDWKESLGNEYAEIHDRYVDTIGNLTLIRHNQVLGNKSFAKKKIIYEEKSGLQIAKSKIINCNAWGVKEINERAKWLTEILLNDVMPIPIEMRRTNNYAMSQRRSLSFLEMQLIGKEIVFIPDMSYRATVVSDKEVEFEGTNWKLSALTKEIMCRIGKCNKSGTYRGTAYWAYDGIKLRDVI